MIAVYDWKADVIQDLKTTSLPVPAIASKHGRSPTSVWNLKREMNISRPAVKRGMKRFSEMEIISSDHTKLGLYLTRWRQHKGATKTELANVLKTSASKLGEWEAGRHDFTLSEMQAISEWVGPDRFQLKITYGTNAEKFDTLH